MFASFMLQESSGKSGFDMKGETSGFHFGQRTEQQQQQQQQQPPSFMLQESSGKSGFDMKGETSGFHFGQQTEQQQQQQPQSVGFGMLVATSGKSGFNTFGGTHFGRNPQPVDTLNSSILELIKAQDYEKALTQLNDNIASNPAPELYYHRSVVLGHLNRWEESFADANKYQQHISPPAPTGFFMQN